MGADGAATLGALGNNTVRQPVKKLTAIDNSIIVGVSGPIGLGQVFVGTIEQLWTARAFSNRRPHEAMTIIRDQLWPHAEKHFKAAANAAPVLGAQIAAQNALSHSVVALPVAREACLFQFDQQCGPEQATANLPFVAIGSGQPLADPFLAFLRHVFWKDSLPNMSEGIFAAVWSLEHAIRSNPGGVAEPMQLMTLSLDQQHRGSVKEFDREELEEHRQAVKSAETYLADFNAGKQSLLLSHRPPRRIVAPRKSMCCISAFLASALFETFSAHS